MRKKFTKNLSEIYVEKVKHSLTNLYKKVKDYEQKSEEQKNYFMNNKTDIDPYTLLKWKHALKYISETIYRIYTWKNITSFLEIKRH